MIMATDEELTEQFMERLEDFIDACHNFDKAVGTPEEFRFGDELENSQKRLHEFVAKYIIWKQF